MTDPAPRRKGEVSFWWADTTPRVERPTLSGTIDADVAIIGAGYTGLWTAYYLAEADPKLRIVILERRFAGYGASGRNGGWLTSAIAGNRARYAASRGRHAVLDLQQEMICTVDEVLDRLKLEGIDAGQIKGGALQVARNEAQLRRAATYQREELDWGDPGAVLLNQHQTAERIAVAGSLGGVFSPHTARVNPVKLLCGLAEAVERRGVTIYEGTEVTEATNGLVRTQLGQVRARAILRCTEGFTSQAPGLRRELIPINSSMLVSEVLTPDQWAELGWAGSELLGDMAHAYMYAQRTEDGRIAFGGRGNPYRYGSGVDTDGQTPNVTIVMLQETFNSFFPSLRGLQIEHVWSGVLGAPRDWCARIEFDPRTGLGMAGGYTGHGVATANLFGRTLRDLVLGRDTALTNLPHVHWRSRRWEPEPLRWLGVQAVYAAYRAADRLEAHGSGRTSLLAKVADRVSGRH